MLSVCRCYKKDFGILYLTITSSNKYAYAKLSKCNTKYFTVEKCWHFYWSMFMLRIGSSKHFRPRNTLQLSVLISVFRIIFRLLCKILSRITVVFWSVQIHLLLNMICFEYFSWIHALLFLSKIFTASCWLDVLSCVNFVAAETVPSLWIEIVK